jgi:large subunit ribosomal protein L30
MTLKKMAQEKTEKTAEKMSKIAIIRIRGKTGVRASISDTLKMLHLYNKNHCAVVDNKPCYVGMINKIKDYVTWGEIDKESLKLLLEKRGRLPCKKHLTKEYLQKTANTDFDRLAEGILNSTMSFKDVSGLKPFFRLKPPEGGFERKGIKQAFSVGGSLGYRKDAINKLIRKMI